MCNGKSVYIDEDPWLMSEGGWKPVAVKNNLRGRRVVELLKDNGTCRGPDHDFKKKIMVGRLLKIKY